MAAAEQLGYMPNPMARALMTKRTGLIGLWMSLSYSRYRCQVLDRMRSLTGASEWAIAVSDVDEEYHWNHSFSRALRVPVEGIIAFDASASVEAFGKDYDRLAPNTPFVSMGAYWYDAKSFVGIDLRAGADQAIQHVIATGRKKIGYIAPIGSGLLDSGVRYESYSENTRAAGLGLKLLPVEGPSVLRGTHEVLAKCVAEGTLPEAILCLNDDLALVVSSALQRLGVRVGEDVALVGFDGIEETEFAHCPITTVQQPMEEMGRLAFDFLKSQMEDHTAPLKQIVIKPQLVIRDSSQG